jgi:hypothetical protein
VNEEAVTDWGAVAPNNNNNNNNNNKWIEIS